MLPARRTLHTDNQVLNRPLHLARLQVFDPQAAQRKPFSNLEPSSGLEVIMMVSVAFDSPHRNSIVPCGHRPVDSVPLLDRSSTFSYPTRKSNHNKPSRPRVSLKKKTPGRHNHSLYWTVKRRITKMYCTEAHMKRKATTELKPTRTNIEMVSSQRVGLPMHTRSDGATFVTPTSGC